MDTRLLDEDRVMQICFVTHDLEKSAKWFADLTGNPKPKVGYAASPETAQAIYHGKPASVGCRLIMFAFGSIDVEFLESCPGKSACRDLLEQKAPAATTSPSRPATRPSAMCIWNPKAIPFCNAVNLTAAAGIMPITTPCWTLV